MLEELAGDVLVDVIVLRELEGDAHQVERVHRHPARAVGLVDVSAGREPGAAVEDPDVVEPEEAALENVAAERVLAVHPPGEIEHELVKHALEELEIAVAAVELAVDLEHAPGGPGVHRRVHVAERPLVGRDLAVRMHVPLARQEHQLMLGEGRVDHGEGDAVKRQIPGGVPGVLPLVGHGQHVGVGEVAPLGVAALPARLGRRRLTGIAVEPERDVELIELLAPDEPGECLALHDAGVLRGDVLLQVPIEFVGFLAARLEHPLEVAEGIVRGPPHQANLELHLGAGRDTVFAPDRSLGARLQRIHARFAPARRSDRGTRP